MKSLTVLLLSTLMALAACTKSKEVHPELGDGNDEIVTVGMTDVYVEYTRTDHAELNRVVFHYCPADANGNAQQFEAAEMTKKETFFELVLDDLICDTLYWYYYELFPNSGDAFNTVQKTFHTQACDTPEPPEPPVAELPTVVTIEVTGITAHSVSCIGEVINDGGAEVTERGVCWSTNENPTLEDNHVAADTGTGTFTATIEGLEANTTYHLRAYATNEVGTAYGLDKEFVTLSGGGAGEIPEGAINGLFTINENGDQIYFSQGNLQYNKTTNEWSFMEHQYDRVESDNQDVGDNYSSQNIVSLLGWGTSGYNHGANCYLPYSTSQTSTDYFAYGNWEYNLYDQTGQADWGYNAISNGGNQENSGWRTLTVTEWDFLISRSNSSGILWAKGIVNGVNGVILLPDNWDSNYYTLNHGNTYTANDINLTDWDNSLEAKGAVFLPAACTRYGSSVLSPDSHAFYWSSCSKEPDIVWLLYFNDSNLCTDGIHYGRFNGGSVRLVKAVK